MSDAASVWLQFTFCVALIGVAGPVLCRSADVIAEETGVSGSWIGLVVLASVTSLPELVIGASAVTLANGPDIAIGDALGSCVFNLALLAVLDVFKRGPGLFVVASGRHVLAAGYGIVLIGTVGLALLLPAAASGPALGHVGLVTPVLLVLYGVAMRSLFRHGGRDLVPGAVAVGPDRARLRRALLRYAAGAVVIVAAGVALPLVATRAAALMGWQTSFMGTLFVAGATSVPEMVVTLSALRIGAIDMAVANLLGSNLFDMLVIAIDDVLFVDGPVLRHVDPVHALSALSSLVMTGLVVVGLGYRPGGRLFGRVGWIGAGLIAVYLINLRGIFLGS